MSKVASFRGYGRSARQHVVLSEILHFQEYSSNSDSGTSIYFSDGSELLVGESPSTVAKAIEGDTGNKKPPPIPPPLRYVKRPG
jgi:hypothetical protein